MILLFATLHANAQQNEIYSPSIASLTVMTGTDWRSLPVTTLRGEPINIAFDELSHDYHRYTYTIEHCEADWTVSEDLFSSDFMQGFLSDNTIDDYELSEGTYQLYTHYRLSIPNDHCQLTMSGKYKLTVTDDDDEPVLSACFMVTDETAKLTLRYTTNTDIDINSRHQQLTMEADYRNLKVTSPESQLYIVVMQNQRRDNAVVNPKPQYKMNGSLRWEHCRELIFPAGNEYHKFEMLDPSHTTMGLEAVGWEASRSEWHAYVAQDTPARNYVYDVDANGSFLIRNSDNDCNDTKTDYIITHFQLNAPRQDGAVFLSGVWTKGQLTPEYEMKWNYDSNLYEASVKLKQGYYSYRYLVMHDDGTLHSLSTEGDFFQTENSYQALLYYRGNSDRTYRLVGYACLSTAE